MRLYPLLAIGLSLLLARETRADTIVLKNGRRIAALSVSVEGDKVRYLTSAGELALPKSIVDHSETGQISSGSPAGAANLAITPPSIEPTAANVAAESGVVRDGAVDREFLAAMASEARSDAPGANEQPALTPHAPPQFAPSHLHME